MQNSETILFDCLYLSANNNSHKKLLKSGSGGGKVGLKTVFVCHRKNSSSMRTWTLSVLFTAISPTAIYNSVQHEKNG